MKNENENDNKSACIDELKRKEIMVRKRRQQRYINAFRNEENLINEIEHLREW